MRGAALAGVLALAATGAAAQGVPHALRCLGADGSRVHVALWSPSADGAPLHCVEAPALKGVASCAPDGGWGLSRNGALVELRTKAAGLEHDGGWFFAYAGPSEFIASAAMGARPPLTLDVGGGTFWRMRLNPVAGEGVMATAAGEVALTCEDAP